MNEDQVALSRRALQKAIYSPRFANSKAVSTSGVTFTGEWYQEIDPKKVEQQAREREAAEKLGRLESFELPEDLEYAEAETLSFEAREKLARRRPRSLGEASRIPGVRPADLQNLVVEVLKRRAKV